MKKIQADQMLREQTRWMQAALPLGLAALGLTATLVASVFVHPSFEKASDWSRLGRIWAAGMAVTLVVSLAAFLLRRRSRVQGARVLDDRLAAKNRLEAATTLQNDTSAIARAQREETAAFLGRAPIRPRNGRLWTLAVFVALLGLAHLVALVSWTRPWIRPQTPAAVTAPEAPPSATIKWRTPGAETKAAPIEEVPLEAVAESTSGLRDVVLELSVNGTPRLKVPIAAETLQSPGTHPVQASIYLDQLEVQPYDVVSYHLRAQRVADRKLPETVSPVQFVQVRPFRDDVREMPPGEAGGQGAASARSLKAAQLRLIKQNFLLTHTEIPRESAEWKDENARVGKDQATLEQKTAETVQELIDEGAPAEIVNLLTQAQPFMADASKRILATDNPGALGPQGKALGLITEVEKFFVKVVAQSQRSASGAPPESDPFRDRKQLELKQRFQTKAGELELLAQEQERLAGDLATGKTPSSPKGKPDPNRIEGTATERQTQISQRLGALLNGQVFVPEVTKHLEQGRNEARKALQQLDAEDVPAAREPAAAAARELAQAVRSMNKAAEEESRGQLAEAMNDLNRAADQARTSAQQGSEEAARRQADEARKLAAKTARELAEAARKQQETGSQKEASRLNDLAKAVSSEEINKALERLREKPRDAARAEDAGDRLQDMADRAAQRDGAMSAEEVAALIDRMERARVNMQRLARNESQERNGTTDSGNSRTDREQSGAQSNPDGQDKPGDRAPGGQNQSGEDAPANRESGRTQGAQASERQGKEGESQGQGQNPGQASSREQAQGQNGGQNQGQREGQNQGQASSREQAQGQNGGQNQGQREGQRQGQNQGQGEGQSQRQDQTPGQGEGQRPGQGEQPGQGEGEAQGERGRGQGQGQAQASGQGRGEGRGQGDGSTGGGGAGRLSLQRDIRTRSGELHGGETSYGELPAGRTVGPVDSGDVADAPARSLRLPPQDLERFARELMESLRDDTSQAMNLLPESRQVSELRRALTEQAQTQEDYLVHFARTAQRIEGTLEGVINLLRTENQRGQRQHQLTESNPDEAPEAYRPAVADYFEQLSRDYSREGDASQPQ